MKTTVLLFSSLFLITSARAQLKKCATHFRVGINASNFVNGNGHGGFYNVSAVLNSHRNSFAFGFNWQKAKKQFTGAGLTYTFNVIGLNESCTSDGNQFNSREELNLFCTVNYYQNAALSNATIKGEGQLSEEMLVHYRSLKLKTVEMFAGVGYNFLITNSVKLRSFIGVGYYSHLNYNELSYHDKGAVVLMTGIGIGFLK